MGLKTMFAPILAMLLALPLAAAEAGTQRVETGFLNREIVVAGESWRYVVYVPSGFSRARRWPVILALHGSGEYGSDGMRQTLYGVAAAIRQNPDRFPAIVVFPQARADGRPGWQEAGGQAAMAALDAASAEFSGDPARLYLTGLSAGGNGAWFLASRFPGRFAAVAVVCGFATGRHVAPREVRYPALAPGASPAAIRTALAARLRGLPIWIFHGAADTVVRVEESRGMAEALRATGNSVRYTEFPGVGHDAWTPAYGRAELWEWLLAQRRHDR
jgi:predicted peptidase